MLRLKDSELPPHEVSAAAELVGRYFSERNVNAWAIGQCASRSTHDELVGLLREALPELQAGIMCHPAPDLAARISAVLAKVEGR